MTDAQIEKKIVIADDEPDLREALEMVLSDEGYRVIAVADGRAALEAYEEEAPHLLILDLNMPQITGMELLRIIRSEKGDTNTPVMILTAHADLDHVADATAIGGMKTDFFPKADIKLAEIVGHVAQRLRV